MSEERDVKADLRESQGQVPSRRAQVASFRDLPSARKNTLKEWEERRQSYRREHEPAPDRCGSKRQGPTSQQRKERRGGRHRPAKIVHHLPPSGQGNLPPARGAPCVAGR